MLRAKLREQEEAARRDAEAEAIKQTEEAARRQAEAQARKQAEDMARKKSEEAAREKAAESKKGKGGKKRSVPKERKELPKEDIVELRAGLTGFLKDYRAIAGRDGGIFICERAVFTQRGDDVTLSFMTNFPGLTEKSAIKMLDQHMQRCNGIGQAKISSSGSDHTISLTVRDGSNFEILPELMEAVVRDKSSLRNIKSLGHAPGVAEQRISASQDKDRSGGIGM